MQTREKQSFAVEIGGHRVSDAWGVEGTLSIDVRRTVIADSGRRLLPDLGRLRVLPAAATGIGSGSDLVVPLWPGDAVWLDFTSTAQTAVEVRISGDGGPETLCLVPHDPWIERCRQDDGSTRSMTAPAAGMSRIEIHVAGAGPVGGVRVALWLVDATVPSTTAEALPAHDPLQRIDYADHNVPWPFD